jgi:threonine aldolase
MKIIDLHSDTTTKPTYEMRKAMFEAEVGDDVSEEDPTVKILEQRVAKMFNKEAALFFPSGTMSNLTALLTWCPTRGSEVIVGDRNHIFLFEQTGAAQFGGISLRQIPNLDDGSMDLEVVETSIRDNDIHEPITKLICIENTHNCCGGKILPIEFMEKLKQLADSNNLPVHMDGARIWNALTKMNISSEKIGMYADSLSVCLSKGLSAPVGSLLVGPYDFIKKARRIRKALGGGMRQVGILAAAGLKAIDNFEQGKLIRDHQMAETISIAMKSMNAFNVHKVETNIIFADILAYDKTWDRKLVSYNVNQLLNKKGIVISVWSPLLIRIVLHNDIEDNDVEYIIKCLREVSDYLLSKM